MQLLLCIDVIGNPKNSELFALCEWWEGGRRDESRLYKGGDRKNDGVSIVDDICLSRLKKAGVYSSTSKLSQAQALKGVVRNPGKATDY